MFVGRAGTFMASKKNKFKIPDSSKKYEVSNTEDTENQNQKKNNLVISQFPMAIWSSGIFIAGGSIFLFANLWNQNNPILKEFHQGHWWQYLIAIVIFALGISFIFAVKMETVTFDTFNNFIKISRHNICCCRNEQVRQITAIDHIFITKRGRDSIMNKSLHYKIIISFRDALPNVEILETNSLKKTKERVQRIKSYLGIQSLELGIQFVDETGIQK